MRMFVEVLMGDVGMTWQRHTAIGRSQFLHICRRRCSGGGDSVSSIKINFSKSGFSSVLLSNTGFLILV